MEDVEVMEDVEDETELLLLIVNKLISKNSKSFENIPELIETRLTLKTFSKEYRKTRAFAELTSFKKITRKKTPKNNCFGKLFSGKFSEHFRVFETRNLSKNFAETKIYRTIRFFCFAIGGTFSRNYSKSRNCYRNAWP